MKKSNFSQPAASPGRNFTPKSQSPAPRTPSGNDDVADPLIDNLLVLHAQNVDCYALVRLAVMKVLLLLNALIDKTESAFAAQPYNPNFAADAPVNQQRVLAYMAYQGRTLKLLASAAEIKRATRSTKTTGTNSTAKKSGGETPREAETTANKDSSDDGR